uniref:Non-structural/coat protein fusion product n=1 Tax=Clover yellow mosaic virus TaxID=12177 RepID=Q66339_CYMV|nr:non-structural/coat protein fusion product [Clover yellow mosaic virus]
MARVRASLSQFTDPSQKILIQSDQYENVKKTLGTYKLTNPYAHSESTADLLEDLGIATNPFAAEPHTHGAAKAIENDLYYIASTRMTKEEPVTFMFMKRAKLQYFRRGPQQNDTFINQIVEPKDVARYDEDTLHSTIPTIETKTVFIGDTLHFLPPSFLTKLFARNPKIQTVLATMVLPTEALYGLTSLYPNVYSLSYHKPSKFRRKALFSYAPGGHKGAENWASQNYKEADRFAAFDFFEGVSSSAALSPPGGLIREPSPNERMANETNKNVHLYQTASRGSNLATTSTVATKGAYSTNASNAGFLITGPE